jgi:hypothetical protein
MGTDFRGGRWRARPFRFGCCSRTWNPTVPREARYGLTDGVDHLGANRDPESDLLTVAIEPNLHLEGIKELTLQILR